jgi:hypothetical protein
MADLTSSEMPEEMLPYATAAGEEVMEAAEYKLHLYSLLSIRVRTEWLYISRIAIMARRIAEQAKSRHRQRGDFRSIAVFASIK